jgi:pectate lyase
MLSSWCTSFFISTKVAASHRFVDSENNVFEGVTHPVFSGSGYAYLEGNDLGGGPNTAPNGTRLTLPYIYTLDPISSVKSKVTDYAGAKLSF